MKDGEWFMLTGHIQFNFPHLGKQIRWDEGMIGKMSEYYRRIFDRTQAWDFVQPFYG